MLHLPAKRRERILLFGAQGTGKTNAAYSILHKSKVTSSLAEFFWLDTDGTAPIYGVEEEGGVVFDLATDTSWEAYPQAISQAWEKVDPARSDWLIIDRASLAWDRVQDRYIETKLGKTTEEFFSKSVDAAFKEVNWNIVNAWYRDYMGLVNRWPGHVLVTASEEPVKREGTWQDKPNVQRDFRAGYKPAGQKDLAYQMFTVLWMQEQRPGEYTMTTIKDIKRERVSGKIVDNFCLDYLVEVGGWQL